MNINTILNSGDVVRFHNHSGIDKQRNSEHQWGVALIVQHIYPECSKQLLLAALTHDAAEYHTGDISFPAKHANPELGKILRDIEKDWEIKNDVHFDLHHQEERILKIADTLEGMKFCIKQVKLGHINAKRPFRKWRQFYVDNLICGVDKADKLFEKLVREMEEL